MALWFGGKWALLAQGVVLSGSPASRLHCNLDTPFKACIFCWKVTIAVYVNATIVGYRLKKDATSSQNMGRFGPGLVKPGLFGWFCLKCYMNLLPVYKLFIEEGIDANMCVFVCMGYKSSLPVLSNINKKRPRGRAVSAPDFGSRGRGFESRWRRDSSRT